MGTCLRLTLALSLLLAQDGRLPAERATRPVKVADFDGYTEGVVIDAHGTIFVSLLHRDRVVAVPSHGRPYTWLVAPGPNGHRILPDGTHLLVVRDAVLHVAADGQVLDTLPRRTDTLRLRSPNDLALDGDGGVYITDPIATDAEAAARLGRVYYVDARGRLTLAASDLCYANGAAVRPDGRVLYVDDSCTNEIYAFDVRAPGMLGPRRRFAVLPDSGRGLADGMTFDDAGRLYVAHFGVGRVEVFDTAGRVLRRYSAGNRTSSNLAFGGPGLGTLYISGAPGDQDGPGALFRLPLGVHGRSSLARPAAAPDPVIPVYEEPRHHLVYRNALVRVLDIFVPPGDTSHYHVHAAPLISVTVQDARSWVQALGRPRGPDQPADAVPEIGDNWGQPLPYTHRVANVDSVPYHRIAAEWLAGPGRPCAPLAPPSDGRLLEDGKYGRIYEFDLAPHGEVAQHLHDCPGLTVVATAGDVQFDGRAPAASGGQGAGRWYWRDAGQTHIIRNTGDTPVVIYEIDWK